MGDYEIPREVSPTMLGDFYIRLTIDQWRARATMLNLDDNPDYTDWFTAAGRDLFSTIDHGNNHVIVPFTNLTPLPAHMRHLTRGFGDRNEAAYLMFSSCSGDIRSELNSYFNSEIRQNCTQQWRLQEVEGGDNLSAQDQMDEFIVTASMMKKASIYFISRFSPLFLEYSTDTSAPLQIALIAK